MIVFDGVARPDDARLFEAGDGGDHRVLHILRQRGRDAVRIDGVVVEAFRLEEDLMPVALAEPHDLVLDRRAIARTAAGDLARIHRRAMHVRPDDRMGRVRGAGDAAFDLRIGDLVGQGGERLRRIVRRLHLHRLPVDGLAVEPGRGAGLEASQCDAEAFKRKRQSDCRRFADPAGGGLFLADMDQAAQEGPSGKDHRGGGELAAIHQAHAGDAAIGDNEVVGLGLDQGEVSLRGDLALHCLRIEFAVGLGAGPTHRRPLAAIEDPELDAAGIGHAAHQAVQGIDLAHQMALAEPADGRIAGHGADGRRAMGDKRGRRAHARGRRRGLAAGMPAADHDHVETLILESLGHRGVCSDGGARGQNNRGRSISKRSGHRFAVRKCDKQKASDGHSARVNPDSFHVNQDAVSRETPPNQKVNSD